jgi:hypothetical protein
MDHKYTINLPEDQEKAIKEWMKPSVCDLDMKLSNTKVLVFPKGTVITEDNIQKLVDEGICQVWNYWEYIEFINRN